MAIVTRRFSYQGPWRLDMQLATDPALTFPPANFRVYFDATYDNAVVDAVAFDERMRHYGCFPDTSGTDGPPNGTAVPFLGLRSPDGSIWELQVDNLGALSTVKRSP